ncbi:ammonium transporter [Actinoplanes oblitus]|uniref:Ammonium transporter n=1 Tax=Actinoplanes oblitus TaxID=3040509 RepID=A0ABY8WC23_9ACTN|nr:ammonium transporter [Actinoplanes oblitus]WIM95032.1 ammonium transporter [Actinoplanes oblitus]
MTAQLNSGDTAWLLVSAALVLLMIPGLALFYGGMVRIKSTLNMLMMTFACLAVVSVIWVAYGYSLAFGPDAGGGLIGDLSLAGMTGIGPDALTGSSPTLVFAAFQMMFAIITAALLSGAIADRAKFSTWVIFVAIWVTLVYAPIAHWVFSPHGWIAAHLHILDLAGGTVVEINSGASGLALAIVLGQRLGFRSEPMRPHSLPLVVLGAGLLWFGWFGFNAGSALAANGSAGLAFFNTQVSGAAGIAGWLVVERLRDGHATTLGAASGAVAGLVAITPACGAVNPLCALLIGVAAGALCGYVVGLKQRLGLDDSLDVAGVHGVGGFLGTILIGLLATATATGGPRGLLFGGGLTLFGHQAAAAVTVALFSFAATWLIATALHRTIGFRVTREHEHGGLDLALHGESAYDLGVTGAHSAHPRSATVPAHPSSAK